MRTVLVVLLAAGVILTGCGSSDPNAPALSLSQTSVTVAVGRGATVTVTGAGSTEHLIWSSADASIASVTASGASGTITGIALGHATVDVQLGAAHASIDVTVVEVDRIAIAAARTVIPLGETEQMTALGRAAGDRDEDVTQAVTWTSQDPAIASVDSHGLVTVHAIGNTAITASQEGVVGTLAIAVSAAELETVEVTASKHTLAKGLTVALTARGTFSDGTVADLTAMATWATSNAAVARMIGDVVQSVDLGSVTITATINGVSGSAVIEVGPPVLTSIHIQWASTLVAIDMDQQLSVTGDWSDGSFGDVSARTVWSVTGSALSISALGLAHGVANGDATVVAQVDGITDTASFVVETPLRITIGGGSVDTPNIITIAQQQRVPLLVFAEFPGGDAMDLTTTAAWSSSDAAIVSTVPARIDTPYVPGAAVMYVAAQTRTGVATVTVAAARVSATIEVHVTAETCHPVINEVLPEDSAPADEWIELYNPCSQTIDVHGWTLVYHGASQFAADRTLVTLAGSMAPGALRLYAGAGYRGTGAAAADGVWTDSAGVLELGSFGVGLLRPGSSAPILVSGVAFGTVTQNPFLARNPGPSLPISRVAGARAPFDGKDTGDNHSDFFTLIPSPKMLNYSL